MLLLLCIVACKDPYDFQPNDPTKPDPPDPPVLVQPANGWDSNDFTYPQNVTFGWHALSGALLYQIEVYRDSLLRSQYLSYSNTRVTQPLVTAQFGWGKYYWHVRAASRNWNNYTDWSEPFSFVLPNPAQ